MVLGKWGLKIKNLLCWFSAALKSLKFLPWNSNILYYKTHLLWALGAFTLKMDSPSVFHGGVFGSMLQSMCNFSFENQY